MKSKIIILILGIFILTVVPIEVFSYNTLNASHLIFNKEPQPIKKKYKKRTDHAPKTVKVRGYRKKNGTYVKSYKRRKPIRRY